MKIGELASSTGVTTKTIRYYESIGLMPQPSRAPNGYRDYDTASTDRIEFIRDAQAAGLSLVEINLILDLRDQGESTCGHVISMLEDHVADVDRQVDELARTRSRLESMIERAKRLDPADCTDPNRCQTIAALEESN